MKNYTLNSEFLLLLDLGWITHLCSFWLAEGNLRDLGFILSWINFTGQLYSNYLLILILSESLLCAGPCFTFSSPQLCHECNYTFIDCEYNIINIISFLHTCYLQKSNHLFLNHMLIFFLVEASKWSVK
jgi:hypothetical protein